MSWTVFRNHARHVWSVKPEQEALDIETGIRQKNYRFKRVLALVGSSDHSFSSFLNLAENMIVLEQEATLIVIDDSVYSAELVRSKGNLYVHKLDKVEGNEYRYVMDQVPT